MSARKMVVLVTVLALSAVLLAACGGGGSTGGGSASVTITGSDDLKWSVNAVTVKAGQATTITLVNSGKVEHNFVISELNIRVDMPAGKTVTATIPASAKAGTYQYICDVPGHKEAGMVGTLTIQ